MLYCNKDMGLIKMKYEDFVKKLSVITLPNEDVRSTEIEIKTDHKTITIRKDIGDPEIHVSITEGFSL